MIDADGLRAELDDWKHNVGLRAFTAPDADLDTVLESLDARIRDALANRDALVAAAVREVLENVARVLVEGGDVLAADEVRKHATAEFPARKQRQDAQTRRLEPDDAVCEACGESNCTCYGDVVEHGAAGRPIPWMHENEQGQERGCPAKHGALGRICELPIGHPGMHTGSGHNGSAVWEGDAE